MASCNYPDCTHAATHWVVRHLPEGYLPNPDARAYCDDHAMRDVATAIATSHAPVERAEIVEIGSPESVGA